LSISLLNIDRFSQFFNRHTQLELCNKMYMIESQTFNAYINALSMGIDKRSYEWICAKFPKL